MSDPILDEIRRIREESARRFGFDAQAMGRYFIREQKKNGHPLVDLRKKKPALRRPQRNPSAPKSAA